MVLMPSKTKYRKKQKGQFRGLVKKSFCIAFGDYGMQSLDRGWITAQQIEAARVVINRFLGRKGKLWIRIFPDKPVSKKPAETRMGKGKGAVTGWVAVVRPGQVLFELGDTSFEDAQKSLKLAAAKISVKTKFVTRLEKV
ncbi:MAG: 50S ribosomal protein L16 [Chlamydiae bacterium SM23_39]|nr:MAG: 50S ribosomal protein L16 [Chlamydiae bacterium SM23_39]